MFSIIVPTHNRKNNVELCLTAIKNQTLDKNNYEVILIDDGSTDETYKLLDVFKNEFRFKYAWLHKKDAWNASRPRNYGAKLAEKETDAYIFIDSDVVLNPQALSFYWEDFQQNQERVVIGPYNWLSPMYIEPSDITDNFNNVITNNLVKRDFVGRLGSIGDDVRKPTFVEKGNDPSKTYDSNFDALACFGGNILMPRKTFWKVGGFSEDVRCGLEDGDMGLKLWESSCGFSYDARVIGYHVWHEIPASRFPPDLRSQIDDLNMRHFKTNDPDHGLIAANKEFFKRQGIENWSIPPEYEINGSEKNKTNTK